MGLWDRARAAVRAVVAGVRQGVAELTGNQRRGRAPAPSPPPERAQAAPAAAAPATIIDEADHGGGPGATFDAPTVIDETDDGDGDEADREALADDMGAPDLGSADDPRDVDSIEWEQSMIALREAEVDESILDALQEFYDDVDGDLDADALAAVDAEDPYSAGGA